ncbi:MAG: hypothetical protein A2655_02085 [Candidatus Yanofskybacteria bacterium RIFCSPHIGHO2_01_FULL_43_42]|uniref:Uncharacterized protein n=1 Tax=Candidatus Yanofskybacteria bacterium RIFCSPLOWO2_01_FULL_43_22 TaxID=1802695 RepID=A0A1F8GH05_9BACT|nr:MAG: hypothetical protein A2655_02085 [Candidatus Yanofskybacteria bacterium RIFCSPHIGHO2_01_FULL_43_42]OGN13258.1 MAG: hypothetical protein A3D48_02990 [Candidatus Yanofskybacteria bacterium RIFCSPHIGHO2_02_FULL_43_17]OGN24674.1 MAG: hypothetical protein A3A13_01215 [Candidatus Yanofskybacteria bacterium RIFCSPLOWO2_01_FULL_43_22]
MVNNKLWWAIVVAVGVLGYWVGDWQGYSRSQNDVKKAQEVAAQKAAEDAAKAANPFKATNPLEGVESNPFEEAKKVLNPFN